MLKPTHNSSRTAHSRRGVTTLTAVGGLALSLTVLAVVVDLGRMSLCRQRLQFAADAAALAAAAELRDTSVLYPGAAGVESKDPSHRGFQLQAAKIQAEGYVADNVVADRFLGVAATPSLQLNLGAVDEEGFYEQDAATLPTAVEVKLAFSQADGNGLSLFVARWFGGQNADVSVRAVAKLDRNVVGFKPQSGASIPCMPIVLQYGDTNGWATQAKARTTTAFNDRFRFDELAAEFSAGADGVPELIFTVATSAKSETPTSGWIAQLGANQREAFSRQILSGLNETDLHEGDGKLVLGEGGEVCQVAAAGDDQIELESLVEELRALQGQPRIWPLGQKNAGGMGIEQFAAGRLLDCYMVKPGVMAMVIQPCLMQTSTAITRAGAESNPWIAKLELAY